MSLKSILLLVQFSIFSFSIALNAQIHTVAENYSGFAPNQKTALFIEDFNNNNNNWYLGIKEDIWFENIQECTLFFQSYEDVPKEDFKEVIIDQSKDFEIDLKIRLDKGIQNKFYGLQWGKSIDQGKQFDFFINGQGQFTIDKFTGEFTDFVPVKSSKLINNYTYNTLTVRKVDNSYYFFINRELVHKMPFEPFFGNGIGFQVAAKSSVQIDYLHVCQLSDNNADKLPKLMVSNESFSSPSGKVLAGETVTMKFTINNNSSIDANNLKLRYNLPSSLMMLENKSDLQLKAQSSKEIELVFYINKNIDLNKIPIELKVEGAQLEKGEVQHFELALNQAIQNNSPQQNEQLALYRSSNDPLKGLGASKAMQEVSIGRYFALIIGINNYSGDWKPLKNAVNDAKAVEAQLTSRYEFQSVRTLYNEQATRANILKEYEWLMANIKENDNLLIFYSGHGDYNEALQRGFWVPSDATSSSISGLIANTDIQSFLNGIKSKHTFLIADACFSGDIFRGKTLTIPYENSFKYYNQIYSKQSRTALTSGGIEPVMDGGKDGHSVFTYYLLKSLTNNENQFFDASQLYNDLKVAVINNSNQTPGFSPIVNTGDEGGQFIFIKKQNQ
ncbi:MAG: caspase family protein [Salinivirgaceae bacterium]|nr:caspase family protein [Salinivirgaceae bacterium]